MILIIMKKFFYLTFLDLNSENNLGLKKKIDSQIKAFEQHNLDLYYNYKRSNKLIFKDFEYEFKNKIDYRLNRFNVIYKFLLEKNIKFIYIRYPLTDIFFLLFLRKIKSDNTKIFLEIPTFPYDFETNNINYFSIQYLNIISDKVLRIVLKKYIYKIVTFSDDDEIFSIDTIKISNGINLESIPLSKKRHIKNKKAFNIISVSSLNYWHGIDRLIKGLNLYFKEEGIYKNIKLHIVGDGPEKENLIKLVNRYELNNNVIFYGYKTDYELNQIFAKADIAAGSLGRFRSGIKKMKALKNTEYAARGLPMFYSEINTDFDDKEFVFKVSHDEKYIKFNQIIEFYNNLRISPLQIRNFVEKNITWEKQMGKIVREILID